MLSDYLTVAQSDLRVRQGIIFMFIITRSTPLSLLHVCVGKMHLRHHMSLRLWK